MSEKFHILREESFPANDLEARASVINSKDTVSAAAACTCGVKIPGFTRTIEANMSGPGKKQVAVWQIDDAKVVFNRFEGETIDVSELIRRSTDQEWIDANPDHPISYMAVFCTVYRRMVEIIRSSTPMIKLQRGRSIVTLDRNGDRERQTRLLDRAGFAQAEIAAILASLEDGK
jgi:hypothetical protein